MNVALSELLSTLPIRFECIHGFSSDGILHSCDFGGGRRNRSVVMILFVYIGASGDNYA